jgi:hypothetical protein
MVFFSDFVPPEADKSSPGGQVSDLISNPRNIRNMPVVIVIVLLDLGKKSSFVDKHYFSSLCQATDACHIGRRLNLSPDRPSAISGQIEPKALYIEFEARSIAQNTVALPPDQPTW